MHTQWGDEEDAVKEAVDMCPVDCISFVSPHHANVAVNDMYAGFLNGAFARFQVFCDSIWCRLNCKASRLHQLCEHPACMHMSPSLLGWFPKQRLCKSVGLHHFAFCTAKPGMCESCVSPWQVNRKQLALLEFVLKACPREDSAIMARRCTTLCSNLPQSYGYLGKAFHIVCNSTVQISFWVA